jgi:hypothetical protein
VRGTATGLDAFVAALTDDIDRRWRAAETLPQPASSTVQLVSDRAKADLLYANVVRQKPAIHYAAELLRPAPSRGLSRAYPADADLAWHHEHGPTTLADRIRDFAAALFAALEGLDVLDAIELDEQLVGPGAASRLIERSLERARAALPFAPGLLSLVETDARWNTLLVVRTAGGEDSLLAQRYRNLARRPIRFLDHSDRQTIDITGLTFGFPAFLIHALHEGHRLANAEVGDLWPVTAP